MIPERYKKEGGREGFHRVVKEEPRMREVRDRGREVKGWLNLHPKTRWSLVRLSARRWCQRTLCVFHIAPSLEHLAPVLFPFHLAHELHGVVFIDNSITQLTCLKNIARRILRNDFKLFTKNRVQFPILSCSCTFLGIRATVSLRWHSAHTVRNNRVHNI
jgi:hypothetical protein